MLSSNVKSRGQETEELLPEIFRDRLVQAGVEIAKLFLPADSTVVVTEARSPPSSSSSSSAAGPSSGAESGAGAAASSGGGQRRSFPSGRALRPQVARGPALTEAPLVVLVNGRTAR